MNATQSNVFIVAYKAGLDGRVKVEPHSDNLKSHFRRGYALGVKNRAAYQVQP